MNGLSESTELEEYQDWVVISINIFNKFIKKIGRPIEIYTFLQTRISFWDMTYFGLFPWLLV